MSDRMLINIRYSRTKWHIFKLLSSKLMYHTDNGELKPANASVVATELFDDWIFDQSLKWFPVLLKDFEKQGIENDITKFLRKSLTDFVESAIINSAPNVKAEDLNPEQLRIRKESLQELADLKSSMEKAGWGESEINTFFEEAQQK